MQLPIRSSSSPKLFPHTRSLTHTHTHASKHMHSHTHTERQHGGQVATSSLCLHISPTHTHKHTHVIQTHTFTIYTVTRLTRCARRCVYHDQLSKTNPNLPSRCRCCRRRRRRGSLRECESATQRTQRVSAREPS